MPFSYVTFTEFLKVENSTVVALHTHVFPKGDQSTGKVSYAWLDERQWQELAVLAHAVLYSESTGNIDAVFSSGTVGNTVEKPKYRFKRSGNLRALFTFKSYGSRQHLVIRTESCDLRPLIPCAAFISEHGRRVIPYLGTLTSGSGYRSYRVLPNALHAFVDCHELTSAQGIFKVLSLLDPTHKRSLDMASYFCQSGGRDLADDNDGVLPEVPLAGLRQRGGRKGGKGRGTRSKASNQQQSKKTRTSLRRTAKAPQQPTLPESFANGCKSIGQPDDGLQGVQPDDGLQPDTGVCGDTLAPSVIDEFFDFDSQRGEIKEEAPVIDYEDNDSDCDSSAMCTPCLSPQLVPLEDEESVMTKKKVRLSERESSPMCNHHTPGHRENQCESHSAVSSISPKEIKLNEIGVLFGGSSPIYSQSSVDQVSPLGSSTEYLFTDGEGSTIVSGGGQQHTPTKEKDGGSLNCKRERCGSNEAVDEVEYDLLEALFDVQTPLLPSCNDTGPHSSKQTQDPCPRTMPDAPSLAAETSDDNRLFLDITNTPLSSPIKSPAPLHFTSHCGYSEERQTIDNSHSQSWRNDRGTDPSTSPHADTPTSSSWLVNSPLRKTLSQVNLDGLLDMVDLTESDDVLMSSKELSVKGSQQSQEEEKGRSRTRGKKRKRLVNPSELFKGARSIREVPPQQIRRWTSLRKDILVSIFQRKEFSQRHESFLLGSKKRAALQFQVDTRMFTQDQVQAIADILLKIFCAKHMKFFSYVMSVLLPECIIRIIADFSSVEFDEAEKLMYSYRNEERIEID